MSSDPNLDYDYPVNEKKPVQNIRPLADFVWCSSATGPSRAVSTSWLSRTSTTTADKPRLRNNKTHSNENFLNFVIPLQSENDGATGASLPPFKNSSYYDIPRNVPTLAGQQKQLPPFPPTGHSSSGSLHHLNDSDHGIKMAVTKCKPAIPQKSSFVKNKISNYKMPLYQNLKANNSNNKNNNSWSSLPRNSTTVAETKSRPPLPQKPTLHSNPAPPSNATITNNKSFTSVPLSSSASSSSSKTNYSCQRNNISNGQNNVDIDEDDDDDDDDECDYDYNYVCLEPKKKLDADDEKVKSLLGASKETLQCRYENLVLRSSEKLSLEQLEQRMANMPGPFPVVQNGKVVPNHTTTYHYYRSIIVEAMANFECWTRFTIEIIRHQYKPDIYFNFVKHILLSGQYLLSVFKLMQRHSTNTVMVRQFGDIFLEQLKQIVTKTRKASAVLTTESFSELIECIGDAARMASSVHEMIFGFK